MLAQSLTPILLEIETILLEAAGRKHNFSIEAYRAAMFIFMDLTLDQMFNLQQNENMSHEDSCNMAVKCGEELRKFVKTFTDLDSFKMYGK